MLKHCGTKPIRTERLLLRRYREIDAAAIYKNYAADARVTRFLPWEPYSDIESLRAFISEQVSGYSDHVYNWVIEYEGEVVGSISAVRADEKNESCEIGYCLGFAFWNKGIATEALSAVLEFLFCEAGYHRIFAKHDIKNPASGKVMRKCNMVYEGRLREHYLRKDGTRSDSLIYSILQHEFVRHKAFQ